MRRQIRTVRRRIDQARKDRQLADEWRLVHRSIELWLTLAGYDQARLSLTGSVRRGGWQLDKKPNRLIHVELLGSPSTADGGKLNIYHYATAINEGYRSVSGDSTACIAEVSDPRIWRHRPPYLAGR